MHKRASTLVEAAIFAAIAVVFNLVFYYIPVLGILVNMLMPLPVAICGMRCGLRWSIMSLLVASVLVALLVNPLHALFFAGVFGIMGVVLGECMYRRYLPARLLIISSVGALIGLGVNLLLAFFTMGINPITTMVSAFDEAVPEVLATLDSLGMDPKAVAQMKQQMQTMVAMIKIIFPGAFVIMAPLLALVNYVAARKVLSRVGETFPSFPSFADWTLPFMVAPAYFLGLFGLQYLHGLGWQETWQYVLVANIWAVTGVLLVVQGLSLVFWLVRKYHKPKGWATAAVALCFLIPFVSMVVTYAGAYDLFVDFRRLRHPQRTEVE